MVKIEQILSYLKQDLAPINQTVDELLFGQPNQEVTKIATTFNASIDVIKKAVAQGVQLLISHEGIYYAHRGMPDNLPSHEVFHIKNDLISTHELAIFRYHDYIHHRFPDPITAGLVEQLSWHEEKVEHQPYSAVVTLQQTQSVASVIAHIKKKLHIPSVRVTGPLELDVNKIGLLVGYRGGSANTLPLIEKYKLDLLIVGEAQEWETAEYIIDCNAAGINKSMITIGHMASEAYGMKLLAQQLQEQFPTLSVTFIENKLSYQTI